MLCLATLEVLLSLFPLYQAITMVHVDDGRDKLNVWISNDALADRFIVLSMGAPSVR